MSTKKYREAVERAAELGYDVRVVIGTRDSFEKAFPNFSESAQDPADLSLAIDNIHVALDAYEAELAYKVAVEVARARYQPYLDRFNEAYPKWRRGRTT